MCGRLWLIGLFLVCENLACEAVLAASFPSPLRGFVAESSDAGFEHFTKEYVEKFFPKALLIADYLYEMSPDSAYDSLKSVTKILTAYPWYYFKNKAKGFNHGEHWEAIFAQLRTLCTFLDSAYINLKTLRLERGGLDLKDCELLKTYWNKQGKLDYFDTYALYCDYVVKLFNESISTLDIRLAKQYSLLIVLTVGKMRAGSAKKLNGPSYIYEYEALIKRNEELLASLKKRMAMQNNANDSVRQGLGGIRT